MRGARKKVGREPVFKTLKNAGVEAQRRQSGRNREREGNGAELREDFVQGDGVLTLSVWRSRGRMDACPTNTYLDIIRRISTRSVILQGMKWARSSTLRGRLPCQEVRIDSENGGKERMVLIC